jgi:hypothetical protein
LWLLLLFIANEGTIDKTEEMVLCVLATSSCSASSFQEIYKGEREEKKLPLDFRKEKSHQGETGFKIRDWPFCTGKGLFFHYWCLDNGY